MATIQSIYLGELRTQATHLESGTIIYTDAPKDNQGLGSCFSPTDLLATSLGACMLTIMAIAAKTHGFENKLIDTKIDITKIMSADPRRLLATLGPVGGPGIRPLPFRPQASPDRSDS